MLTQEQVARELGVTRQAAAKLERSALEKCRVIVALQDVFPRHPGEAFAHWWGRLRSRVISDQTRDGQTRRKP